MSTATPQQQQTNTPADAIAQAVELAGGQTELARQINALDLPGLNPIKQGHVSQWLKTGRPSADYCLAIERVTGITRYQLRPQTFGQDPGGTGDSRDPKSVPAATPEAGSGVAV